MFKTLIKEKSYCAKRVSFILYFMALLFHYYDNLNYQQRLLNKTSVSLSKCYTTRLQPTSLFRRNKIDLLSSKDYYGLNQAK